MNEQYEFDGATYEPEHDQERLSSQLERVFVVMMDGHWWGLKSLAYAVNGSEAGVSARIRDFRKEQFREKLEKQFGSYTIERRRIAGGLYQYRMGRPS